MLSKHYYDFSDIDFNNIKGDLGSLIHQKLNEITPTTDYYKILFNCDKQLWINPYYQIADQIRNEFECIVIVGMGGAILNPRALLSLLSHSVTKKVQFIDNTDPFYLTDILARLSLKNSFFIVISNSGETLETLTITKEIMNLYHKNNISNYHKNFLFITNNNNSLYNIANEYHILTLNHAEKISGRYATFTNVTTLIGLICEIDMAQFFLGANNLLENFWLEKEESAQAYAAFSTIAIKKPIIVNIGYLQCFYYFLQWYSQIIAESLGKDGKGFTPLHGLGPNDQHSMFQLYLDGADDKQFTLFYLSTMRDINKDNLLPLLTETNNRLYDATLMSLLNAKKSCRTITLDELSPYSAGKLMMNAIIEVILIGLMTDVNPFDQPAVEVIKNYAKIIK